MINLLETITKTQYALIHCNYEPSDEAIKSEHTLDRNRNPHNYPDKPKLRSRLEIIIDLKKEYINLIFKQ